MSSCLVASAFFWSCHLTDWLCSSMIEWALGKVFPCFLNKCSLIGRKKSNARRILQAYTWRKSMSRKVWSVSLFFWYGDWSEKSKKRDSGRTKHCKTENTVFVLGSSSTYQSFLGRIEVIILRKYFCFGGSISFSHHLLASVLIQQSDKIVYWCNFVSFNSSWLYY